MTEEEKLTQSREAFERQYPLDKGEQYRLAIVEDELRGLFKDKEFSIPDFDKIIEIYHTGDGAVIETVNSVLDLSNSRTPKVKNKTTNEIIDLTSGQVLKLMEKYKISDLIKLWHTARDTARDRLSNQKLNDISDLKL